MKALAFILACLCLCAAVYTGMGTVYRLSGMSKPASETETVMQADYEASSAFASRLNEIVWTLYDALAAGELSASQQTLLDEQVWYYASADLTPEAEAARALDQWINDNASANVDVTTTQVALSEAFESYEIKVEPDGQEVVVVSETDTEADTSGQVVLANTTWRDAAAFRQASQHSFIYEQGVLIWSHEAVRRTPNLEDSLPDLMLYISFKPDFMAEQQARWSSVRSTLQPALWTVVGCVLTALVCVVYLSFVTGRRPDSEELYMSPLDSIYSDLQLCLLGGFGLAWVGLGAMLAGDMSYSKSGNASPLWFAVILTALCIPAILALWLSIMRNIKARRLMRHSLTYVIISGIFKAIRGVFRLIGRFFENLFVGRRFSQYPFARALFRRQAAFILLSFLMVCGFIFFGFFAYDSIFLAFGCVAAELVLIYYYTWANNRTFEEMEKICTQVYEICQGNMTYDPGLQPGSQLYDTSIQLMDVGSGMDRALERQLQSERMKIALVTNVSHDLKTPLTSIIGYIDLLQRDETLSPEARDYVTILTQKSQRLKSIIEDLFDLAKTTSGDESSLNMEVLDLRRLIEQTLADMEDKIERSGQVVRQALPELPVFIRADGGKLYRVIQNITDNALKYSMPGTRIFVSLTVSGQQARVSFKNTASYEMDFSAEEVLERFARGDKSRTTEGSGLGLSIAEGFTRAVGGELKVSVDGDQFKVELSFDVAAPPQAEPEGTPEEEPLPAGLQERMSLLRSKLYQPRAGMRPTVVNPAREEPHFEPERPVELSELESVLEAFESRQWLEPEPSMPPGADGADMAAPPGSDGGGWAQEDMH